MSGSESPATTYLAPASTPLATQHLEQEPAEPETDSLPTVFPENEPLEKGRPPPPNVRANIERLLEEDSTRLGDAYRGIRDNRTAADISSELGIDTVGWFYHKNRDIRALLEGDLPDKPSVAGYTRSAFKLLLKEVTDEPTKQWLKLNLDELESIYENQEAKDKEVAKAGKLADTEFQAWQGVYVYTFPHYHWNPVDNDSDPPRTIMKVGQTAGQDGIRARINQQISTAAPEEPLIYRAYRTTEIAEATEGIEELSRKLEGQFHKLLDAAGHRRTRAKKEWFLTSLEFLDALAESWGLEIGRIFDIDSEDS